MERKSIKEFSKELFNNQYVNISIDGSDTTIGKIVYEDSSQDPLDFYILQNEVDGVPCDIVHPWFKYSYYYDSDIEIFELTESEISKITENIELLKTLKKNEIFFIDGDFKNVTKNDSGDIEIEGIKTSLNLLDDFIIVSDKTKFLEEYYKPLLNCKYLLKDSIDVLRHCIANKYVHNSYLSLSINNMYFSIYLTNDGNITYNGVDSYNPEFKNYSASNITFPSDSKYTGENLNLLIKELEKTFESNTCFDNSLMGILKSINCDENVKNNLMEGKYYHNMQFIKYDQATEMISFTPKGKQLVYVDNILTEKNRQTIKPHKFFNTILKGTTSEYDIKCIADKILAFYNSWSVKYFKGKKLAENYSTVNTRNWATISCMDRKAENFFELYTQTPFRLGVIYREGEIVGRFIEVTCEDKFVYNDRLYYKDETVLAWYNSWVDSNKMNRKQKNSQDSKQNFYNVLKGNFNKKVVVKLRKKLEDIAIFPYLDTLTFGYRDKLQNFDSGDVRYEFTGTSGRANRIRCKIDVISNKWIDDNIAVKIDFGNKAGEYTIVENLIFSVQNQKHCLK